jgi:translocation and assembly module TamA
MSTLQLKPRTRLPALSLLALCAAHVVSPAHAGIEVQVLGVADEVRTNVLAYLSFERYKNSDDLSPEFVERLQERTEREVRAALRPFGFYEPAVNSIVKHEGTRGEQNYRITIMVIPGKPVVVQKVDVKVTGPGATDEIFTNITRDPPVRTAERLNHAAYETLKGSLLRAAANYGYLDARMLRNEMRVDPQSYSAEIEISFETGPRYHFGATTITQDTIDDALVRRYLRYKEDEPFNASELLRTQFALDDSQYFSTVEVLPGDRDRDDLEVPVNIVAEPNRRRRYQFGVGYGTDTELRGTAAWEDRRVNHRGHRFRTEVKAASLTQSIDGRYIVPIGDPATEKFTLQLTGEHERLADIDDQTLNFTPSLTRVRGPWFGSYWQRVTYLQLLHSQSESVASGVRDQQTLLIPGISFALVPRNYLGEALLSRGLYAELRGSHESLGSDSDFLQVRLLGERVIDIAPNWHVFLRADFGATSISQSTDLPPSQRFFAGGDRSVRGYGVNELSPVDVARDVNNVPIYDDEGNVVYEKVGGKHLVAASVELIRDLPWKKMPLSVAVFGDVGNAFDKFGDPLMYSVGIGLRLRLPIVSVGIDVAQGLTIPPGSSSRPSPRLHLNFSPEL